MIAGIGLNLLLSSHTMLFTSPLLQVKNIVLVIVAFSAILISFALMPQNAHAAALSISTATTTSNNASTTLAKVGDTVSFRLVLTGTPEATTTPVINIFGMGTTSMSGAGATWTYSTTSASTWTTGFLSFYLAWGGSTGEATTTVSQSGLTGANIRFDKTAPTISSITSDATASGVLKVGDTILFTLTPGSTEYGGSVAGSYNGTSLSWSTANSGATYTATYTVTEGHTDQGTALQISSVVLSDAAGNTATGSGSDIVKTIDANSPAAPTASLAAGDYSGSQTTTLSSNNSDSIRYTIGGAAPTCSVGNVYSSALTISTSQTIQVIGCDSSGNTASSVSTFNYTIRTSGGGSGGSGGGGGGGGHTTVYPVVTTHTLPALPATASPVASFARSLAMGAKGNDVKALQIFLNTHGFLIATTGAGSLGNETTTFGSLTRAALAKFQASKGITPAVGYFGPITRAAIAGL